MIFNNSISPVAVAVAGERAYRISCAECGQDQSLFGEPGNTRAEIARIFYRKGWREESTMSKAGCFRTFCPSCASVLRT